MSALQTFSPLSLNQLTRDLWGRYDGSIIAQLAALADDPCYMMKFYKAPSDEQEVMAANSYAAYGMEVTPGSIIFGFYLPTFGPAFAPFNVQITDVSLGHKWFDAPTAALVPEQHQSDVSGQPAPATRLVPESSLCSLSRGWLRSFHGGNSGELGCSAED